MQLSFNLSQAETDESIKSLFNRLGIDIQPADSVHDVVQQYSHDFLNKQKLDAFKKLAQLYSETRMTKGKAFGQSSDIFNHFRLRLRVEKQEHFIAVFLDNKHQYLSDQVITKGTLNRSLVHPREVFAAAIEQRAAAVIVVHNHPSGDPSPSQADHEMTKRLVESRKIIGIPLLDHLIIGNDNYFSLADEGCI